MPEFLDAVRALAEPQVRASVEPQAIPIGRSESIYFEIE